MRRTLTDVGTAVSTSAATPPTRLSAPGRLGPWFALTWLFFLGDPLLEAWGRRDEPAGAAGLVVTVAFGTVYMGTWLRSRRLRWMTRPADVGTGRSALLFFAALVVLGALDIALLGEVGLTCVVYVAIAAVILFPSRVAAVVVVVCVVGTLALGAVEDWGSQAGVAFGTLAGSVAIFGLRALIGRNVELLAAHERNAELAVENERTRFARDLHDVLGHSLTVITVKAELARRLLESGDEADRERARTEVGDLERLGRDALADVRRAVEGYREISLAGEIARARLALEAAGVEASLPGTVDDVPSDLRDLFAWTIREGVTNVVRHADVQHCAVTVDERAVEVRDDGRGPADHGAADGHGLAGLRERASEVGATVVVRSLEPGLSLRVESVRA
jgi:two-component system sensor histidine kinase DesK